MIRRGTASFVFLVVLTALGCSVGERDPISASITTSITKTTTTADPASDPESTKLRDSQIKDGVQILLRGGTEFCKITDEGVVWIDGDRKGSIETNGEIWVAGSQQGSIESDGEVWKAGSQIGGITRDLDVWRHGKRIGMIDEHGTVWRQGESIGTTQGGDPRYAAIVFYYDFFTD